MKFKKLGRTGIEVSEICLGTMTWGNQNSEAEAHEQMDYALSEGVNFFDTAEMYPTNPKLAETQGRTEEYIGSWFRKSGRRNDVVLATKITGDGLKWVRDGAPISASGLRDAVAGSLRRLKTDHIDLYQLHWPNRGSYHFRKCWTYDPSGQDTRRVEADLHETLETLASLVREGKIRAIGLSNETAWGTMQFLRMAEEHGFPRVATIQNEYNLALPLLRSRPRGSQPSRGCGADGLLAARRGAAHRQVPGWRGAAGLAPLADARPRRPLLEAHGGRRRRLSRRWRAATGSTRRRWRWPSAAAGPS